MNGERRDSEPSGEIGKARKRARTTPPSDVSEDDEHGSFANEDIFWKEQNGTPKVHNFLAVSGVTVNTEGMSRREVFELFCDEELIKKVTLETNKYGTANEHFLPVTENELRIYIALSILMSLVQKPTIQSYWCKDESIETPYFRSIMPRNRFLSIATNLRFASDNSDSYDDPLTTIREVSDTITKNFIRVYKPHKNISITASSIQYIRKRSDDMKFLRMKPTRFGSKIYKLCDSESRYIHNFEIYAERNSGETGCVGENVVMNLLKKSQLLDKGYCLFIDNSCSSPTLHRKLHNMQTNVCGTVRLNSKGMPQGLKSLQLEKGEAVAFSAEDMTAIRWRGEKDVVLLTTMHGLEFAETKYISQYTGEKFLQPTAVIDYNKNMCRVDGNDQTLSKFHSMRRCKDAYKELFFYLVDMMLLNTYILFKSHTKIRAFHVFKQKLAEEIIVKYLNHETAREKPSTNNSISRYTGRHFPTRIPQTVAKGRKTSKRCFICLSQSRRRETVFKCDVCDVPLCIDHFKDYHTKK